ncbi:outer membrane beta-barrel protein [Desulfococcaceae bacterium HSG8]|nr:outer membrane beta-barrel protein [Desulfococcaceae bacterium HSG8]
MYRKIMHHASRFILIFLMTITTYLCSDRVQGDDFNIIPSVTLKQEYNDNVFFSEKDKTNDFITTLSPELELIEKTERMDARLSGQLDRIAHAEKDELDALDYNFKGQVDYRLTERLRVFSKAVYKKDSRRDRDMEDTGLITLGTSDRDRYHYAFSGNYLVSEKTGVALLYAYDQDDPESSDYRSHSINLGLTHHLGEFIPLTIGRMNFGYARHDFTDTSVDNYSWTSGGSWQMSETTSLVVDFGGRYTLFEYQLLPYYTEKNETWGIKGSIDLSYSGELTNWKLSFSQDVRAASGSGGTTERTVLGFDIGKRFTEEFRGNLSARYYLNQSDRENDETHSLRINPRIRYHFTRDIILETSCVFNAVREDDTNVMQNLVLVRFIFQYPLFE